jgi:hypothetical protein
MHFLHEHTDGRYNAAVEAEVEALQYDAGRYYPGIYQRAADEVQCQMEFRLPVNGLPWLDTGETTAQALARAEENTVNPEEVQRKRRWAGVQEHRKQVKVERKQAFDKRVAERFANMPAPPQATWNTSARVRAYLERDTIKVSKTEREQAFQAVDGAARVAAQMVHIQGARWAVVNLDLPEDEIVWRLQADARMRLQQQ